MAAPESSVQVSWVYSMEDESIARDLLRMAGVLQRQGLVSNRPVVALVGGPRVSLVERHPDLAKAAQAHGFGNGIAVFLVGPTALEDANWQYLLREASSDRRTRIILVLVRPVSIQDLPDQARHLVVLPKDGAPIATRRDRDDALLEVIQAVQEMAAFRPAATPGITHLERAEAVLSINDIFRLNGPPTVTFVEPPRFRELQLELSTMGTGLIVEGPSKTGKSTAIHKAMDILGIAAQDQLWWAGQSLPAFDEFQRVLDELQRCTRQRWLFINDFHYLEDRRYLQALAFAMKALADQSRSHAKVTLTGINPLGASLVQTMPDLAGRFRIMRIDRERDWERGTVEIERGPADVIASIRDELSARYRGPMLHFAAFDEHPPPRGAGLSLLWLLARSPEGFVSLKEARLRFPGLGPVFDWFLQSNLSRCFEAHPELRGLLYFNRATGTLTMEDPQLKFYLRALDWTEFGEASGHGHVEFHPADGPLWPLVGHISVAMENDEDEEDDDLGGASLGVATSVRRLLHLSDLHFATADQATIAYSQLAADLRQQGIERLDALVVSGDLVNRATATEYAAAGLFVERVKSGFGLKAHAVVLVPGNHDVSWAHADSAYRLIKRAQYPGELVPGTYVEHTPEIIEVRDDEAYRQRFAPFAELYEKVKGEPYPLAYDEQATVAGLPEAGLSILGLNSAWEIDRHFPDRASLHMGALAQALQRLPAPVAGELRIATFHHPIQSGEDSRLRDTGFLQQLAVAGFRLILHGHVHRADAALYRYDRTVGGRRLDIVTAGTFGAPVREWVPGYPLQYNLLAIREHEIVVETRCRRDVNGAWEPDARWLQGPGADPLPRYVLER